MAEQVVAYVYLDPRAIRLGPLDVLNVYRDTVTLAKQGIDIVGTELRNIPQE
jgi:hypothetical protein